VVLSIWGKARRQTSGRGPRGPGPRSRRYRWLWSRRLPKSWRAEATRPDRQPTCCSCGPTRRRIAWATGQHVIWLSASKACSRPPTSRLEATTSPSLKHGKWHSTAQETSSPDLLATLKPASTISRPTGARPPPSTEILHYRESKVDTLAPCSS
jgi:hypothetical protein